MKTNSKSGKGDPFRPEYDLKNLLKDGIQGKYARRFSEGTNLVLLDPDVAEAFPTKESVNSALRLVIQIKKLPVDGKMAAAKD